MKKEKIEKELVQKAINEALKIWGDYTEARKALSFVQDAIIWKAEYK